MTGCPFQRHLAGGHCKEAVIGRLFLISFEKPMSVLSVMQYIEILMKQLMRNKGKCIYVQSGYLNPLLKGDLFY